MKKIIIAGFLCVLNLSAYEMCGDKININGIFEKKNGWTSKNEKTFGVDYIKYEKRDKIDSCQVFVEKESGNIVKLTRTIKTDKPIIPSEKIEGASFGAGKTLYYNSGKKFEDIHAKFIEFKKSFEEGKKYLRFAQAEYKNEDIFATNNTMCTTYGNKCSTVIEIKSTKMKESYFPGKSESMVNQKMKKIVEEQNLKLSNTNGWK